MLFIFRKLRKSFFLPGKERTYLAYAAGEIILIVVGILLALQISEWNQANKDYVEETIILTLLKSDFEENQEIIKIIREQWSLISESIRSLLDMMGPQPDTYPDELIHKYMGSFFFVAGYEPKRALLNSYMGSGKIALIKRAELNLKLYDWPMQLERIEGTFDIVSKLFDKKWDFQRHHRIRDAQAKLWWTDKYDHTGPSRFPYDQNALLSHPELENALETKRFNTDVILYLLKYIETLQQSILDLIDEELAERGISERQKAEG